MVKVIPTAKSLGNSVKSGLGPGFGGAISIGLGTAILGPVLGPAAGGVVAGSITKNSTAKMVLPLMGMMAGFTALMFNNQGASSTRSDTI